MTVPVVLVGVPVNVAVIVDRPRTIGRHEDTSFDLAHHLVDIRRSGLEIDIGHAVDGGAAPRGRAEIRDTLDA